LASTGCDIGANVGQHALFMAPHVESVFAFEPSRWARDRFQTNVTLNGIDNVHIFPFALGDSDREGRLGSGFKGNSGSRSLTWTLDQDAIEIVAIRHGDTFLRAEKLPRVDILKLDVEGYERRVLWGLRETLERDRPIILMELIGSSEKSGFAAETDLRGSLYPEHALFTLAGDRKAKLTPFDWNSEAAVCLRRERNGLFSHVIAS
jgi:FkbM family methyltransferase